MKTHNSVLFFPGLILLLVGCFFTTTVVSGQTTTDNNDNASSKSCTIENVRADNFNGYQLFPISQFVHCVQQVAVNATNFVQYVSSIHDIYAYNYAFYNTAQNATANEPLYYHQDSLGGVYNVYYGPNEGTIDLEGRSRDLVNAVTSTGMADASLFWNVTQIYQQLRDGHITVNRGNLGQLSSTMMGGRTMVGLYFQSYFDNNQTSIFRTFFEIDQDSGELVWSIQENSAVTGAFVSKKRVRRINDQTPQEFLEHIANTSLYNVKSFGARVNLAMDAFNPFYRGFVTTRSSQFFFFGLPETSPMDIFAQDQFSIEYEDGTSDIVLAMVMDQLGSEYYFPPATSTTSATLDITKIEQDLNAPGILSEAWTEMFATFTSGIYSCAATTSSSAPANTATTPQEGEQRRKRRRLDSSSSSSSFILEESSSLFVSSPDILQRRRMQNENGEEDNTNPEEFWTGVFLTCGDTIWNYAIMNSDDEPAYTVLQMSTNFPRDCFTYYEDVYDVLTVAWKDLLDQSMQHGSNKLILDVSGNGGGWPLIGLSMAVLMYPEVPYEHFITWDSAPYNTGMDEFLNIVDPFLGQLIQAFLSYTREQQEAYLQSRPEGFYCAMTHILSLYADFFQESLSNSELQGFIDLAQNFIETPTVESLTNLGIALEALHEHFNPWTVTVAGRTALEENRTLPDETIIRGGIRTPMIGKFDVQYHRILEDIATFVRTNIPYSFNEYIILSNGACGSTCDIFATTVQQIWRNRNVTNANHPLSVVTYGGLVRGGAFVDASQFAGGFAENPSINLNYGPVLSMLFTGVLTNQTRDETFWNIFNSFATNATPAIPNFLNLWPRMPTSEGINTLMMPTGVPIEYLEKTPDYIIPQIYNDRNDVSELRELYTAASEFFSSTSTAMDSSSSSSGGAVVDDETTTTTTENNGAASNNNWNESSESSGVASEAVGRKEVALIISWMIFVVISWI